MDMDDSALKQMFDMHIKECDARDARNVRTFDEVKGMFKGIWDAQDIMKDSIVKLQIKIAYGLGGLIVVSKLAEWGITYLAGHK